MPRRRRRRRRRRVRRHRANMGARSCVVRENALGCDPLSGGLGFAGALSTIDVWESTESEADGIDVFEVEDEYED